MADDQPAGHDDAFYAPLFEPITTKLQTTGGMDLEIFIGELLPLIPARFTGDDVYAAIMRLAAQGILRCDASDGEVCIELVE
jgi:hypothetical protein